MYDGAYLVNHPQLKVLIFEGPATAEYIYTSALS